MISICVSGRNDEHGGTYLPRVQIALNCWSEHAESGLPIEIVFVEWNPPPDRPRLREVLNMPVRLPVRWFEVPPDVHQCFPNCDKMDLFNHLATNVAARRAHGDLVLATTPDIVIGERLASTLRAEVWQDDIFYRAPRHDAVLPGLPFGRKMSVSALTIIMTSHMIQANAWTGGVPYCKSCGDFILMSHSRWCRLRGYVEWSRCGIWLDGLLLHMAVASGMRQQVFPQPCYHMEHEGRGLSIYKGLPHLPRDTYKRLCAQMLAEHRPIKVNPDTWGLAELSERQVGDDAWILEAPDGWAPPKLRWFD